MAEPEATTGRTPWRLCEDGCGCRYGSNDPEAKDCACGGPCQHSEQWGCGGTVERHCDNGCPLCPTAEEAKAFHEEPPLDLWWRDVELQVRISGNIESERVPALVAAWLSSVLAHQPLDAHALDGFHDLRAGQVRIVGGST